MIVRICYSLQDLAPPLLRLSVSRRLSKPLHSNEDEVSLLEVQSPWIPICANAINLVDELWTVNLQIAATLGSLWVVIIWDVERIPQETYIGSL